MYDESEIKAAVRERYGNHAAQVTSCCSPAVDDVAATAGCGCGSTAAAGVATTTDTVSLGYDAAELAQIPEGADLGLGCGNPLAMLELQAGETVLDLGSGAGIDCFLAAKRVGPTGHVIGVDMTPEMLDRARRNATAGGFTNVEFRLGEVEHLPVADATVDAIISNCVINLVPDKAAAFAEAFRVLKPGGRLSLSDIVVLGEVPVLIRDSVDAYVACLSGAILRDDYLAMLRDAGFTDVEVTAEQGFELEDVIAADLVRQFVENTGANEAELRAAAKLFQSVRVQARKAV